MARCPAHEDRDPSLKISEDSGKVLVHCHAGCSQEAVIDALRAQGLWPEASEYSKRERLPALKGKPGPDARWEIRDERGQIVALHCRRDGPTGKKMWWARPDGTPGLGELRTAELPLYGCEQLRELDEGVEVIVCEGEKAASAASQLGPAVGTVTGAAIAPGVEALRPLRRFRALLWPDNDDAGRRHMTQVAERLTSLGCEVWIIEWQEAPEKGDAADFIARFGPEAPEQFRKLSRRRFLAEPCRCSEVLDSVARFLRRFVVLSPEQADAIALWVVHTHCFEAADTTPYLYITSAEKRSGKTRLLEVLSLLVSRPWLTGRVTPAVLPRKIEAEVPTLLLDESDAAFRGDREYAESLRGVLNAGFRRGGATSVCLGRGAEMTYRDFSVFSPKAIAGIGKLPDTLADRSIRIELRRRVRQEEVERFRFRLAKVEAEPIHDRLLKIADQILPQLSGLRPRLPEDLDDRAQDVWEPLLAIAEVAGEVWVRRAQRAATKLSGWHARTEGESLGVRLLRDIRMVLGQSRRLSTKELLDSLWRLEEAPWAGRELNAEGLARMLRPYGIRSRQWREHEQRQRGYLAADFEDAWMRYLPELTCDSRDRPESVCDSNELAVAGPQLPKGSGSECVTLQPIEARQLMSPVTGVTGSACGESPRACDATLNMEARRP
jgi:hypothetical protein